MKYFVDFEAMQFSNYIISIGCVREDGKEFYSLVRTPEGSGKRVSKFITELTGLTTEMIQAAPTPEQVFNDFYHFVAEDYTLPEFYCYGNTDTSFIKASFDKIHSFYGKMILGYMYTGLIDYAPVVKTHFGLFKNIGLKKVYSYFIGKEVIQNHNALEDAKMLKRVYEGVTSEAPDQIDEKVFLEYKTISTDVIGLEDTNYKIICSPTKQINSEKAKTFTSLKDAGEFLMKTDKSMATANLKNIAKRIKKSFNTKTQYVQNFWFFEVNKDEN